MEWLAKIRVPAGVLFLMPGWKWCAAKGAPHQMKTLAEFVNVMSAGYEYSPAHGIPGYRLANRIAGEIDGKAEFPPREPDQEGVIY